MTHTTARPRTRIALAAVAMMALSAAPSARADYQFTSFNGPGSAGGTTVNGVSNAGAIVGFGMNADNTVLTNFVRNPDGTFTTLNQLGSPTANANGVNANGDVVGTANGSAFLLSNHGNTFTVLPPASAGTPASQVAFGINDGGAIVGQYVDSVSGNTPGFYYARGQYTLLNPVANATVTNAQGVNNLGQVIGFYSTDGMHQHGFLYDTGAKSFTLLADPNVANLFLTQFLSVNDHGEAVGYYQTNNGSQHGFLYDLATKSYTFLDDPNAVTNSDGISITQITGVSNSGEITGFYVGADGLQHGFFATPNAVPEPGSLALLAVGLVGGWGALRRRKERRD